MCGCRIRVAFIRVENEHSIPFAEVRIENSQESRAEP
jgi:hypothetical protein